MSASQTFLSLGDPSSPDSDSLSVPPCLLGEAAGQLAAWTTMAANDFTLRPVGALIEKVEILGQAHRGDPVLLDIPIDDIDGESLVYHGVASVLDSEIFRFENAFSPLLPVEQFDDPTNLRKQFGRISQPGDGRDRSPDSPNLPRVIYQQAQSIDYRCDRVVHHHPGREMVAEKQSDGSESFFDDHFPRKPVVPLTVLMECLLRMARELFDEGTDAGDPPSRITVRNAKINRFVQPNDSITTTVQLLERGEEGAHFRLRCDLDGRRVCQAKVEFSTLPK